jgi:hypothetical protein
VINDTPTEQMMALVDGVGTNHKGIGAVQEVRELPGVGHRLISEAVVYKPPSAVLNWETQVIGDRLAIVIRTWTRLVKRRGEFLVFLR